MEKILVVGVNTRPVVSSLKRLGYEVYSSDYFGTMDLVSCADYAYSFLDQKPGKSCGRFVESFSPSIIEEMALEMVNDVDGIICCTGVSPDRFPKKKILGNHKRSDIEDKYQFYKKFKNHFKVPDTYSVNDVEESLEIASSYPEKRFILKPRLGSGGYHIRELEHGNRGDRDNTVNRRLDNGGYAVDGVFQDSLLKDMVLQEFISGENVSASVLSTGHDSKTVLTTTQIIGDTSLGQREPFGYCGNIAPYHGHEKIHNLAQKIVDHVSLKGSNGVDFIITPESGIFVIEVNPRIQGTFECIELACNLNMAEAHLEACQGNLHKIPTPSRFAVKMIVYARTRSRVNDLNIPGIYDIPMNGVIIEGGEPLVTVLSSGDIMENAIYSARQSVERVYASLTPNPEL